jgi:hypothetical protein
MNKSAKKKRTSLQKMNKFAKNEQVCKKMNKSKYLKKAKLMDSALISQAKNH